MNIFVMPLEIRKGYRERGSLSLGVKGPCASDTAL